MIDRPRLPLLGKLGELLEFRLQDGGGRAAPGRQTLVSNLKLERGRTSVNAITLSFSGSVGLDP